MANRYSFFRFCLTVWLSLYALLGAQAQVACPAPTNVTITGVSATSATVVFTGPANATAYTVTYSPPGMNPNLGVTVTGTSSPIVLTGLMANTSYSVCVQTTCGAGSQSTQVCPLTFTTSCSVNTVWPYTESFDGVTAPALPCGITVLDANNDGIGWNNTAYPAGATSPNCMCFRYNASTSGDDWFFTRGLQLQVGTTYQLQFKYRGYGSLTEALEVKVGPAATAAGQTTTVFSNNSFNSATYTTTAAGTGTNQVASFTPPTSGTYYFGFHSISPANQWYIYVDDIQVTASTLTATKSTVAPGFHIEASPVPFGEQLTLSLNTLQAGPMQLTLHDAVGRVVRQSSTSVPAGASSLAVPEAGTLPAGMYLLTVRQGGNTQVMRVAHE